MTPPVRKRRIGTLLLLSVLTVVAVVAIVYFVSSPAGFGSRAPKRSGSTLTTLSKPADHFVTVRPQVLFPLGQVVTVTDQFGSRVLDVLQLERLWTPAAKEPKPLSAGQVLQVSSYPNRHYLCYWVKEQGAGQSGVQVTVTDQFGSRDVTLGLQNRLCAPATKKVVSGTGHDPNAPLGDASLAEHLDCFPILNPAVLGKDVTVRDQFGQRPLKVLEARELCAPSLKALGNRAPSGTPSGQHYLCYGVTPLPLPFSVDATDQFKQYNLLVLDTVQELCVPAEKQHAEQPTPSGDGATGTDAGTISGDGTTSSDTSTVSSDTASSDISSVTIGG